MFVWTRCHKKTHFVSVVSHNRNCLDSSRELTGKQQLKGAVRGNKTLVTLRLRSCWICTDGPTAIRSSTAVATFPYVFFLLPFMAHLSELLTSWVIVITGACLSQLAPQSSRFACSSHVVVSLYHFLISAWKHARGGWVLLKRDHKLKACFFFCSDLIKPRR